MAYKTTRLDIEKGDVVRRLFTDTADDNYIAARWCSQEALNVDFFWMAVHTLEKYMKAILLLNQQSAIAYNDEHGKEKRYGHDITLLYSRVLELARDLLPENLERPANLDIAHWQRETPPDFMQRFFDNGNADNRYLIYGFVVRPEDVHKLDSMVFALRRLCIPLDAYFYGEPDQPGYIGTHRDVLTRQPDHWNSLNGPLDRVINSGRGEALRRVALNLNLAFAPNDFEHEPARGNSSSANPVLVRRILEPLGWDNPTAAATASEICSWVTDNIQLPKAVKKQLEMARNQYLSIDKE